MSTALPSLDSARTRADLLASIAEIFDDTLLESSGSIGIGVAVDGEHVEVHPNPLPAHPVPSLLGFVAPADWWAFGVACAGMTRELPRALGGAEPWDNTDPADSRVDQPMHIVHLVSRDRDIHSRLTIAGHDSDITTDCGIEGMIPDLCWRVLQLPTSPAGSTLELSARQWLEAVIELLGTSPVDVGWAEVARHHPTVEQVRTLEPDLAAYAVEHLERCGHLAAEARPWSAIRQEWIESSTGAFGLSPADIEWMDDGMLARWCLPEYVELVDLVDVIEALATTEVFARVVDVLHVWELLPARGS